jgi:hypothetical protein
MTGSYEFWRQYYEIRRQYLESLKQGLVSLNLPPRLDGKPLEFTFVAYIPERADI